MNFFKTCIFLGTLLSFNMMYATDGALDTNFAAAGQFVDPTFGTLAFATYIQADGKIVAAGLSGIPNVITVYRLTAAGALDATFGSGGMATIAQQQIGSSDIAKGVAVQSDGKIVVAGYSSVNGVGRIVVARLTTSGSLDSTFGSGGVELTPALANGGANSIGDQANAVVIQTDGKIVVAGSSDSGTTNSHFALVRYNTNGTLDSSFGTSGHVIIEFSGDLTRDSAFAIAFQSDNKIIAAGQSISDVNPIFALARVTSNGTLDTTFNGTGKVVTVFDPIMQTDSETAYALNIQPNGKIIAAGYGPFRSFTSAGMLARYNTDGSLDATFSGGASVLAGTVVTNTGSNGDTDQFTGLALQSDGKIVASGSYEPTGTSNFQFWLVRYLSTGSLDTSFNGGGAPAGMVFTSFGGNPNTANGYALAQQCNGYLVEVGVFSNGGDTSQFIAARYVQSTALTAVTITSPASGSTTSPLPTFAGTAQNPSIIDIFVDGSEIGSTVTTGSTNTWSFTATTPLSVGTHTLSVTERYHDDGHVNCLATITFTVGCTMPTDPYIQLYNSIYPCH